MRAMYLCALLVGNSVSHATETLERRYVYKPSANSPSFVVVEKQDSENPYSQVARIFSNDGKRVLLERNAYPSSFGRHEEPRSLTFQDLNGDGYKDVLVVEDDARNAAYSVFLYEPNARKLVQARRLRHGEADELFMRPNWEPKSRTLNEYVYGGSASASFDEECLRWDGVVAKPYLAVTSEPLKRRDEDDDWRTTLTITLIEQGSKFVRSNVFLGEQFQQRFFSESSRRERCAMWMREFERMPAKRGASQRKGVPPSR